MSNKPQRRARNCNDPDAWFEFVIIAMLLLEKLLIDAAVGWGAREVLASVLVTGSA